MESNTNDVTPAAETTTTTQAPSATEVKAEPRAEAPKDIPTEIPKATIRSELRAQFRKTDEAPRPEATKVQAEVPKSVEPILPPADMTAEEKAEFAKLSPDAQKYLSRRAYQTRSDYTRKTQEIAQKEREIEQIAGLNLAGLRDEYARNNLALPTVIENAVAWDRLFRKDPTSAARQFLAAWGVDPAELQSEQAPQAQGYRPEQIDSLVEQRVQAALQTEQQKYIAQNSYEAVESFKRDKPLFSDPGTAAQVEAAMEPWVRVLAERAPNRPANEILNEAYSNVLREPQFAELSQRLDGRAAADKAKADAERAFSASRGVSGGPGTGTPTIKPKNLREALRLGLAGQLPRPS